MIRNICRYLITIIVASSFTLPLYFPSENSAQGPALPYPVFQKGMSYVTWSKDAFAGAKSDESLISMARAGVNSVAIIVTWYQEYFNSLEILRTERSPSDQSLRHAIRKAHEEGMGVMLKPHIDLIHGEDATRQDIGFQTAEEWLKWVDNYTAFVAHYARIAEEEGVEFFCVGTELAFASTQTDMWREKIIPRVKKAYSGYITYAANWDEFDKVEFWDELDYAGIDAYFPLTKKDSPTLVEIKEGWTKWLADMEAWQSRIGKPVVFTECGYPSADSAARKPWEESGAGEANLTMQGDCYKALFETFWDRPWFYGVYWWNWNTYPGSGGRNHKGFTPQNKPALNYVKEWYAKEVQEKILLTAAHMEREKVKFEERVKREREN